MSSERIIGTETEYGVYRPGDAWANPIALSTTVVTTYGEISRTGTPAQGAGVVRWDYTGEDPLNDLRGMRMSRAAVDPSLLTDDPYHLAPSGGSERVARPTAEELALPAATTAVLTNGARLYVDHAHPEYSAPETIGARDALLWDRAGEVIAQRVMARLEQQGEEPIVLVMYGDHLPSFEWTADEMINKSLYQTEYVVWNNMNLPKKRMDVEAYQLAAHVLDMLGIHEGTMMRFHQNYLNGGMEDEETYLADMKALEYDILYGDREVYGGENPYQTTDLQMGIDPITIDDIVYNDSNILVYGENFTPYSRICLDGKAVETTFVWPELIIAKNIPEKKVTDADITVWQIGRDKIPLGESAGTSHK